MWHFGMIFMAAGALAIAAVTYAQTSPAPEDSSSTQPPAQQSMPPDHRSTAAPSTEDSTDTSPPDRPASSTAVPSPGADQNTRLATLVPEGMSAQEACSDFRSVSECAATLHAAQNCGIPFKDLKAKVSGGEKLGAAIHDLKPGANVSAEVSRAEQQARADLQSAPQG